MDSNTAVLVAGIGGGIAGALATFGAVWFQRRFDRDLLLIQQRHDAEAARQTEMTAGVMELWSVAVRMMWMTELLSSRAVIKWRWGVLVGLQAVAFNRLAGELAAAYTRLFLSADDELLLAARHVVEAGERASRSMGVVPWWRFRETRERRTAIEDAHNQLTDALHDLRDLTRTKLGYELPALPAQKAE